MVWSADWHYMLFGPRRRLRASDNNHLPQPAAGEHPFTIIRNGYSTAEVASFLTRMSEDTTKLRAPDLRRVTFAITKRGYDKAEVNAYLGRIAAELEAELEEARTKLRAQRLAGIDPALGDTVIVPAGEPETISRASEPPGPPATEDREILWVEDEPTPEEPPATDEPIPVVDASDQIADLLRRSHDHAMRLRTQAEADVRSTIDSAQSEVDQRRRDQIRELDQQRHDAEMEAIRIRSEAEIEAEALRAAARALLSQTRAEVAAVKALASHNMDEITAAREESLVRSREILALGRGMLRSVIDLDRECARRLAESRATVAELMGEDLL